MSNTPSDSSKTMILDEKDHPSLPDRTVVIPQPEVISDRTLIMHAGKKPSAPSSLTGKKRPDDGIGQGVRSRSSQFRASASKFFSAGSFFHPGEPGAELDDEPDILKWNQHLDSAALPELDDYFEFREEIGEGGFGSIHKALDKRLMRIVAVKTLLPGQSNLHSTRSAFLTEAKVMAYLDHPGIVPIYGIYTDKQNRLHLVMKLLKGRTLKELLQETFRGYKDMPKREIAARESRYLFERLELFLKACDALAYAQYKKILHRDLKPENIMVGDFNEVYIMDWGIAEHSDVNSFSRISGQIPGTLQYLAPEILLREPYDSRSDLYALGVILYELVFLKIAFPGTGDAASTKIVSGECSPLKHAFDIRVSRDLVRIIQKAMQPVPGQRYQNIRLMAEDIRKFIRNEKISIHESPFRFLLNCFRR